MVENKKVVGIDLGTTNSVVATIEGGQPVVIPNSEGLRTTPSIVAYTKREELLVGQIAKRQAVINPENTFYSVKRFIGSKISEISEEAKQVSYQITTDDKDNIKIKCPALTREFSPEEISAQVLRKLATDASTYMGQTIKNTVITVPAYFNDSQRQATKDAGQIAGLEVLRIINEPTAASLAYGLEKKDNQTILVFDLGGGTFDVSILEVGDGVFEVLSTSGDTRLGGDDFDKAIVNWIIADFKANEGVDLLKDPQALQRITEASEKAKIELSTIPETSINLPFISADQTGPKHIDMNLSRAKFENLCSDLINRCRIPVENALKDARIDKNNVDEVVLVGGSTRIPAIQALVKDFTGKSPNQTVNPDEVVAVGAAVQGGVIVGDITDILLLDVTPLSLGVETIGGIMTKIIPRNTTIPTKKSEIFSTAADNQNNVEIHVLQGERELATDNKSLGNFRLSGIPAAPRGIPQIEVTFDIDVNGILSVKAKDKATGKQQSITIQGASTLDEKEIQEMVNDAEKFAEQDKKRKEQIEIKNSADSVCYQAEKQLEEHSSKLDETELETIRTQISKVKDLKDKFDTETIINDTEIQELEKEISELSSKLSIIGEKVYAENMEPNPTTANGTDDASKDETVVDV